MTGLFDDLAAPGKVRSDRLFYGDNLTIMQNMPSACVDLIYLDPPFNSQRTYNLIYKQVTGLPLPEQEEAFCDAWRMDPEKEEMARNMPVVLRDYGVDDSLVQFWQAWINALRNTQPRLLAYLVYMTYRLFEMRRLLRPTGSLFIHCDPAASHYIKVILDGIFGHDRYRNEIIWKRTSAHSSAKRCGPVHDVIFFYTKGEKYTWNNIYQAYSDDYRTNRFKRGEKRPWKDADLTGSGTRNGETGQAWRGFDVTAKGRHWAYPPSQLDDMDKEGLIYWPKKKGGWPRERVFLDETKGVPLQDLWTDIAPINSQAQERLGYPTQKPIRLLERIVEVASNEGNVVFDPFCGCGTTIYAAHLTCRKWIGIDIGIWSIRIVRDVLLKRYGLKEGEDYQVTGVPVSLEGAQDLFARDARQFQHWVVELAGGFPSTKHSGDRGIDGSIYYEAPSRLRRMVLSVKGGKISPAFVREVRGTMERETDADMAGFICLQEPTRGMMQEVADAGMFRFGSKQYPRLQIRTVAQLLDGRGFETPSPVETLQRERQGVFAL